MEKRIAVLGIVVENPASVPALNDILHNFREFIIGRMGIPYPAQNISIISIALCAPHDTISALSGQIGKLSGVSAKATYSGVSFSD